MKKLILNMFFTFCLISVIKAQDVGLFAIPYQGNLQGMDIEQVNSDTLIFYIGFDRWKNGGAIKKYTWSISKKLILDSVMFKLPMSLKHPNDLVIQDSNIIVLGWTGAPITATGWVNKYTGQIQKIEVDTLQNDSQYTCFLYSHKNEIFRGVRNKGIYFIQKYTTNGFVNTNGVIQFDNRFFQNKPIQGAKAIHDLLYIISSYPSKIDVYDIANDFRYICTYMGEYNHKAIDSLETEGIGILNTKTTDTSNVEMSDLDIYYSIKPPNKIRMVDGKTFYSECDSYSFILEKNDDLSIGFSVINNKLQYTVNDYTDVDITLFDIKGAVFFHTKLIQQKGTYELDLSPYLNNFKGPILIRIVTNNYSITKKFVLW